MACLTKPYDMKAYGKVQVIYLHKITAKIGGLMRLKLGTYRNCNRANMSVI